MAGQCMDYAVQRDAILRVTSTAICGSDLHMYVGAMPGMRKGDLLGHEVQRLQMLQQVNDHVRPQEIKLAQAQQAELATALQQARLRLDSLRLIWKGPPEALR